MSSIRGITSDPGTAGSSPSAMAELTYTPDDRVAAALERIAAALERLNPADDTFSCSPPGLPEEKPDRMRIGK